MNWDDFSEFFMDRRDFFSTLKKWREIPKYPAVYFFLIDPLEKAGKKETEIVYIGETLHLGGIVRNCRLWDYYTGSSEHEKEKVALMRNLAKDHKTMISWLPCLNKPIAKKLEGALLNAFWNDHKENPQLNRTTPTSYTDTVDKVREMIQEMETQSKVGWTSIAGY